VAGEPHAAWSLSPPHVGTGAVAAGGDWGGADEVTPPPQEAYGFAWGAGTVAAKKPPPPTPPTAGWAGACEKSDMMSALAVCALGVCAGALKSRSKMLDWGCAAGAAGEVAAAAGVGAGAAAAVVAGLRAAGAAGGAVGAGVGVSSPKRSMMGAGAALAGAAVGRAWRERRGWGRAPGAAAGGCWAVAVAVGRVGDCC
jgi:hypothetical protein